MNARAKAILVAIASAALSLYIAYTPYQRRTRWYRVKNSFIISMRRIPAIGRLLLAIATSRAEVFSPALKYLQCLNGQGGSRSPRPKTDTGNTSNGSKLVLYAWPLSYFSGKVRAFLRYQRKTAAGVDFAEVIASPEIIRNVLLPATKSHTVPQLELPDGTIVHDSTSIIDTVSSMPSATPVLPNTPRQKLTCLLLELLADEWLLVPAFNFRWAYSGDGSTRQRMPSVHSRGRADLLRTHRDFNISQWGHFLCPEATPRRKYEIGRFLIDNIFLNGDTILKRCMRDLGVTEVTVGAWEASCRRALAVFDRHLCEHPYVLGSRPSSTDFALLGPIYAHLTRDPYPGAMMVSEFPNVSRWAHRLHEGGKVESGGQWMRNDAVPSSVLPLLSIFFDEMWPVLKSSCQVLRKYIAEETPNELPGGSFGPSSIDQEPGGPLTHAFTLPFDREGGTAGPRVRGRRMVLPYQIWLLQRVESALGNAFIDNDAPSLRNFLKSVGGLELLRLPEIIDGCRVRKRGEQRDKRKHIETMMMQTTSSVVTPEDIESMSKTEMIRFIHSHASDSFLAESRCNGRIKSLKKTLSAEELKATMLKLLPTITQKALPAHLIKEKVRVTPTKNPFGESAENTPPMSRLLKSSQKILAVSHATENAARDILAEIENSPTSRQIMKSVKKRRKKKQTSKTPAKSLFKAPQDAKKTPSIKVVRPVPEVCAKKTAPVVSPAFDAEVITEETPAVSAPNTIEKAHVRMKHLESTLSDKPMPDSSYSQVAKKMEVAAVEKSDAPPKRKRKVRRNKRKDRKKALREQKMVMMTRCEEDKAAPTCGRGARVRCDKRILDYVLNSSPMTSFVGYLRSTRAGSRILNMITTSEGN
eukprot:g492.t1